MNREQKRAFVKKARKKGIDKDIARTYAEVFGDNTISSHLQDITEGENVKLNLESIKTRSDYEKMSGKYKEFIESNSDTIFTAHIERPTLVSLVEEPKWLFWCGDLIKVRQEEI